MTTIVFVHGTGVRGVVASDALAAVTEKIGERLPGARVEAVDWGARFGVEVTPRLRELIGIADPGERVEPAAAADAHDADLWLWSVLEHHPRYELHTTAQAFALGAGVRRPESEDLRWILENDVPGLDVAALAPGVPADGPALFAAAAREIAASEEFVGAVDAIAHNADYQVIARAVVATFGRSLAESGAGALTGRARDTLVEAVGNAYGGVAAGGRSRLSGALKNGAMYASWPFQNMMRGGTLGNSVPAIGDILYYQAHGALLRSYLANRIAAVEGPVVVLAHSLGGIASFETLAEAQSPTEPHVARYPLPNVCALITVGSQVAYLGAVGALATHPAHERRPTHLRIPWTNVWNPCDWLSFRAEPVFADLVRDVEIRARQPFPKAHASYWESDALYDEIARVAGGAR
ncbi:hypothetical protein [Streptomyces sp. SID3343]|uniref:hypothetical protein n=1 Tax=Streptomyces sp. SID3343 TaxID=2690260 RepID=UPI00136FA609|nr:hypothetical protein [Streptomyces sp. SID3343]MYW04342.1 hypothetical protein [Streptomyces sp. SID3343]